MRSIFLLYFCFKQKDLQVDFAIVIMQGSPQRMIVQRRLNGTNTVCFILFKTELPETVHSYMPSLLTPDPIRVQSRVWCLFWTNWNCIHSYMPSPVAPDPIRVQSRVWCLFWTNRNCIHSYMPSPVAPDPIRV